jgi:hypothetical protein
MNMLPAGTVRQIPAPPVVLAQPRPATVGIVVRRDAGPARRVVRRPQPWLVRTPIEF